MEQCFIIGNVFDKTEQVYGRSNGAGKSSLMQAIVWCLSGKTVYSQNPGDKVLNWFSGTDAKVSLRFKNGNELKRIRTRSGDTELLYRRGTQEVINCTLSTTSNQQKLLERELKFDYNLFCGSVFFSQYRQPWLAMQDQSRRQAFERVMGIDRLSIYAEVAKARCDKVIIEQEKRKTSVANLEARIASLMQQLDTAQKSSLSFENSRNERHDAKLRYAVEYEEKVKQFSLIDVTALTKKWELVSKIDARIAGIQSQIAEIDNSISNMENTKLQTIMKLREEAQKTRDKISKDATVEKNHIQDVNDVDVQTNKNKVDAFNKRILELRGQIADQNGIINTQDAIIKRWRAKSGKICVECERELPADYANSKIDGPRNIKLTAEHKIEELNNAMAALIKETSDLSVEIHKSKGDTATAITSITDKAIKMISIIDEQLQKSIDGATKTTVELKEGARSKKSQLEQLVIGAKKKLSAAKPELTINEAIAKNSQRDMLLDSAQRAREEAKNILLEKNTHTESIIQLGREVKELEDKVKAENKDILTYDIILIHLQYIQRAYSDRRKIKSYLISRHQPYFNTRLHHYLDLFGLDIKVSLTDSLGIDSNLWGYDFQSGGERGRTDLAFMFAVFDLHQGIHGPQSNILVLDEPEKALDEYGRQMLISVIKDDLATRFESIFIISHSDCFHDVFPHQITVERTDRFSHIVDVR